jgi:hypothetical protein
MKPKPKSLALNVRRTMPIAHDRHSLVTALLNKCYEVYRVDPGDISTFGNTIETYLYPNNQLKYVHMYFAKYVGCWRWVRQCLGFPGDGPVWSIGAGPRLCLMGWFFDAAPTADQEIVALDIAPWREFRDLSEYKSLRNHVFKGRRSYKGESLRFFPETLPPQGELPLLMGARPITPSEIPSDATVLFPMVLNHVIGAMAPHPQRESVFSWLQEVARRVNRVVVIDMQHDYRTGSFWDGLLKGLGLSAPSKLHTFSFVPHAAEFCGCYSGGEGPRRTGLKYAQFCVLSGLVHTRKDGWRYFKDS